MMAALALLLAALVARMYLSGRRSIRQLDEDAETDEFLDVLAQIRNDQWVPRDVAHVHRLAEQYVGDLHAVRMLPEATR